MKFYMHTIDRMPAMYDGQQVCFARIGRYGRNQYLVPSLEQLKDEQARSKRWRRLRGFSDVAEDYGYCIVEVPASTG